MIKGILLDFLVNRPSSFFYSAGFKNKGFCQNPTESERVVTNKELREKLYTQERLTDTDGQKKGWENRQRQEVESNTPHIRI